MNYTVFAQYDIRKNCYEVGIARHSMREKSAYLGWTWVTHEAGMELPDATIAHFDKHEVMAFFQGMLDQAWALGIRPAHYGEDRESAKEIAAIRGHLEDMRSLVFKKETP